MEENSDRMVPDTPWSPPKQGGHIFVVVRCNKGQCLSGGLVANQIVCTRAFLSRRAAEDEVERMNQLNGAKGYEYLCCVARLQEPSDTGSPEEAGRS